MPANTPALQFKEISKHYGKVVAAEGVSMEISQGEFVTLLGQSGSGKTTLLKVVSGFESPTAGQLYIGGKNVVNLAPKNRGLGMVFQSYALFPHLNVADNIAYGLKRQKWAKDRMKARVNEMLELVQMGQLRDRKPTQLSGGQQQRVALARALAFEPPVLLMDEPLGALDRALRVDLEAEIRRIHRVTGATILYVTHDRDEALGLSDRIAVMHEGRVVGLDTPERLYEAPTTAYVARLLTDANLVKLPDTTSLTDNRAEIPLGATTLTVPASAGDGADMILAIPRSSVVAAAEPAVDTFDAEVLDRAYLGDRTKVVFDVRGVGEIVGNFARDDLLAANYEEARTYPIRFNPGACRVVPSR